jgi:uncharacterized protein (UPF0261 family)
MNAPNFAAVLRDIKAERTDEAARTAERMAQWSADAERAAAVCSPDAGQGVLALADALDRLPYNLQDAEAVVLLGAVFRAIYRDDGNRHIAARVDALAGITDAIDGLLAEVARRDESEDE